MPPCSRRRGARPPLFRGGGSLSRRTRCVVLGSSRSLRMAVGAVAVTRHSRRRCLRRRAGVSSAGLFMPPRARRRGARSPLFRGGGSFSRRAQGAVLGHSRSLRVALGAVAVARSSRRRCLRRRAGTPSAGLFMPPCSRRRNARPPLFRGGGSLSRRERCVVLGRSRFLRVTLGAVAVAQRSRHRCLQRCAGALAPACSCRRARGGVSLGRRSSVAAARSLGARGRSPSRGAYGAAACDASLAL